MVRYHTTKQAGHALTLRFSLHSEGMQEVDVVAGQCLKVQPELEHVQLGLQY